MDVKNGSNVMYLPLDKLAQMPQNTNTAPIINAPHVSSASVEPPSPGPVIQNTPMSVPSIEHSNGRSRINDMRGR